MRFRDGNTHDSGLRPVPEARDRRERWRNVRVAAGIASLAAGDERMGAAWAARDAVSATSDTAGRFE